MSYTCLIIDDEPLAQELIEEHVSRIPELQVVGRCDDAMQASSLLAKQQVDLLFLDINMPVMKGIDFFKNLVHKPHVIFTTAYREYALEGFEVSALDYLLKPITFERFFLAIQKFFKVMDQQDQLPGNTGELAKDTIIFVNQGHRKVKVNLEDVRYIESFRDYINIHVAQKEIRIKANIGTFQKKLGDAFLRIHRSYLVNINYVTGYTKHDVELDARELPIGSSYREQVLGFFEDKAFLQ